MSKFFRMGRQESSLWSQIPFLCPYPLDHRDVRKYLDYVRSQKGTSEWNLTSQEVLNYFRQEALQAKSNVLDADLIVRENLAGDSEPERIFNIFFSDKALSSWKELFQSLSPFPYELTYEAVFVHQKPSVRFPLGGRRGCELGDALLLMMDQSAELLSAQFLQAKMIEQWPPRNGEKQWELYTSWPEFEYSPERGRKVVRDLRFPGAVGCAKYLLLDDKAKVSWTTPAAVNSQFMTLGEQINSLFSGWDAKPVAWFRENCVSDWDHLIHDLLEATAKCPVPSKQVGGATGPRGTMFRFLTSGINKQIVQDNEEESWGIPIIIIGGRIPEGENVG